MKKIAAMMCLIALSSGIANANPAKFHNEPHRAPAPLHRMVPVQKPAPIIYQVPLQLPAYSNSYNNSPYLTFSLGNVDVTVGL